MRWCCRHKGHPLSGNCRVLDLEPASAGLVVLDEQHTFDYEAIRRFKNAKKQLGTKLIKAVTKKVVRRGESDEVASDGHHVHAVCYCLREVEDVLE